MSKEKDRFVTKWQKTREQGFWRFVLAAGVIRWGLLAATLFVGTQLLLSNLNGWAEIPLAFIFFPIGGFAWGTLMWVYSEKRYERELT
ncbi:hypothetical protein [Salinisphaera sp. Q1T1-3]|uniref:hypothetical protein n=1 Tax=Salinisphaera sp. Q1T1-3 TaxID=2321229 RepID=UPI0011C473C2|nr:hypothetical protein [Salinisphaera sp. Q1T1-3]